MIYTTLAIFTYIQDKDKGNHDQHENEGFSDMKDVPENEIEDETEDESEDQTEDEQENHSEERNSIENDLDNRKKDHPVSVEIEVDGNMVVFGCKGTTLLNSLPFGFWDTFFRIMPTHKYTNVCLGILV